jgi:NAD(P)-dependent dehydrogenase (short-subunit alcohol dehydrogenase family)
MAGEPIEVPPLESRAGARVRPRTLLCAALRRGIASILVKKDLAEVCPLSRGMMSAHRLNPCPPHYRPAFASSALLYPQPIARQRGAIVNIASIAAFHVTVPHVPYAASKAGVVALTRDLAYEVGRLGIRVNAIAPGPIETPMVGIISDEQRQTIAKNILLGRMGQPEDIGNAAVFLASDAASYITGATLPVSGGTDLKVMAG